MNTGLALKHRPRRFSDLVGQRHVGAVLRELAKAGNPPQQLLLSGGSGLGKTTVARIFAATLLCESPQEGDACGECPTCDKITLPSQSHPDVIELDAASHGGKDEIHDISQKARTLPLQAPYKIYIVDEAHGLSRAGGEAFLKLLEEPPSHVLFFLATTDPEKMLPTNRGRCLELALSYPDPGEIAQHLVKVAHSENWELPLEAAEAVVASSDPRLGVRGALMALSKIRGPLQNGEPIDEEVLATYLGVVPESELQKMFAEMETHSAQGALKILHALERNFPDSSVRSALTLWAAQQLESGSPEQALYRLELLAGTPPGPVWTRALVARFASPLLDGTPAALAALVERAEKILPELQKETSRAPTQKEGHPVEEKPAQDPPAQKGSTRTEKEGHPRKDLTATKPDFEDHVENSGPGGYNDLDDYDTLANSLEETPPVQEMSWETPKVEPPQKRSSEKKPARRKDPKPARKQSPTSKKQKAQPPEKADPSPRKQGRPVAATATLDSGKKPPAQPQTKEKDPWFDNPDAYDTSPPQEPLVVLPPKNPAHVIAATTTVSPKLAELVKLCQIVVDDDAVYLIVPRNLAEKFRHPKVRPAIDKALDGFPVNYRLATS